MEPVNHQTLHGRNWYNYPGDFHLCFSLALFRLLQTMTTNASLQLRGVLIPSLVPSLTINIMPAPSLPFGTERTISTVKAPTPCSESKDKQ